MYLVYCNASCWVFPVGGRNSCNLLLWCHSSSKTLLEVSAMIENYMGVGQKGIQFPKKPIGKRKNRLKPVVPRVFFLIHSHMLGLSGCLLSGVHLSCQLCWIPWNLGSEENQTDQEAAGFRPPPPSFWVSTLTCLTWVHVETHRFIKQMSIIVNHPSTNMSVKPRNAILNQQIPQRLPKKSSPLLQNIFWWLWLKGSNRYGHG